MEIQTQSPALPAVLVVFIQFISSSPANAQVYVEADQLMKVIEAQQRQLEAQEAQIQRQKADLEALRQQVEELRRTRSPSPSMAPAPTAPLPRGNSEPVERVELDDLRDQIEAIHKAIPPGSLPPPRARGDPTLPEQADIEELISSTPTDWPGSIPVLGSPMRVKISGFAELDANYNLGAITSLAEFATSAIVTSDRTAAEGEDGKTNVSAQVSRLELKARTPWGGRQIENEIAMDFLRDSSVTEPLLRLRKAYGQVSDILFGGDLRFGLDWSTFTNLTASPNTLDYEGPNSLLFMLHPIARWIRVYHPTLTLEVGLDAPDQRVFQNAKEVSRWPDFVVAVISQTDRVNFQGSFILRDLRGSGEPQSAVSDTGWGINLSGVIDMPDRLAPDFASYSFSYGSGYGGLLNDAPPDAAYDFYNNRLEAIPTLAWYLAYQHWWSPCMYTVVTHGQVQQDNLDFQAGFSFRETQYSSINLTWTPTPHWLFGVEALYGTREDKDGAYGSVWRTQFTSRISF
ncbi:DcaP family trimeric outer membrane transporter [Microbulbifer variabilis]|uniref:DcaP family trimeric outer membrane transporter n=1 Tax=Microbulbifer variabilis TaxID=266805 RepID=UPI001CFDBC5C|nr:DcaP family trimeric outer membrane transporter [Microbulbifer variabilis]